MSGSELSLRYLPDLSDTSFSFQIPTHSADNLLHADSHDFFGAGDDLLGSPMRANEAPLTLDDLTPRPRAIPAVSSPRAHTANKSLLPTSKFNLHRPTTLRAPKPAPTAHNRPKPKPASGVPSKVKEVSGVPKEPAVREPNSVPPTAVAPPASIALSKPVVHARTKSTVISSEKNTPAGEQRLNTTEVVSEMAPHSPPKPNLHADEPAPSPPSSAPVDNAVAAEQTAHPVRNIAPAATVPAAKPESKSRETIAVAKTKAVPNPRPIVRAQSYPDSADGGSAVGAMDMGIAARLVMYGEQLTAMGSFPASDNDDAMGTGTDPAVRDAAVQDDASGGEIPNLRDPLDDMRDDALSVNNTVPATDPMENAEAEPTTYGAPRDDPLTLSQQSPRKVGLHGDGDPEGEPGDGVGPHTEHGPRAGAVSPMRPAAKRPASVAAVAPITQSKRGRVEADSVPHVPSTVRARGRGGARAVYAPSQVSKQPARKASEVQGQQRVQHAPAARPRIPAASVSAAPNVKANAGALAGASAPPVVSPTVKHATELNAVPVGCNFESEREEEAEGTQPRAKGYSIPDFKAIHASQAAQNALRRSQFAPTVPVPIAFSTDARAKERERFDEKVREKERELEVAREIQRREREEEEAREVRELRRRAIPTAHEVPEWYKEAPRRQNGAGQ